MKLQNQAFGDSPSLFLIDSVFVHAVPISTLGSHQADGVCAPSGGWRPKKQEQSKALDK